MQQNCSLGTIAAFALLVHSFDQGLVVVHACQPQGGRLTVDQSVHGVHDPQHLLDGPAHVLRDARGSLAPTLLRLLAAAHVLRVPSQLALSHQLGDLEQLHAQQSHRSD
mgnify:CR=1 FL=1